MNGAALARAGSFAIAAIVNVALPFAAYSLVAPKFGDVRGLLASAVPPVLWSIGELAFKRRVDAMSLFVLLGIALSLLAFIGGGSARFLQLRENLVTGAIGLVFLVSAAIGKPVIYQLARASAGRKSAASVAERDQYKNNLHFRRVMTLMTLVWGFGLLGATVVACVLVYALPIGTYLIVSPVVGYGIMGALALWSLWYGRRKRRASALRVRREATTGDGRASS